jgi:hypothetical protein
VIIGSWWESSLVLSWGRPVSRSYTIRAGTAGSTRIANEPDGIGMGEGIVTLGRWL